MLDNLFCSSYNDLFCLKSGNRILDFEEFCLSKNNILLLFVFRESVFSFEELYFLLAFLFDNHILDFEEFCLPKAV